MKLWASNCELNIKLCAYLLDLVLLLLALPLYGVNPIMYTILLKPSSLIWKFTCIGVETLMKRLCMYFWVPLVLLLAKKILFHHSTTDGVVEVLVLFKCRKGNWAIDLLEVAVPGQIR